MRTFKDCIPCFYKQADNAAVIAGASEVQRKQIADALSKIISESTGEECPPFMGKKLYQLVIKVTGVKDPFKKIKEKSNKLAIRLYPHLKHMVESSRDRLLTAVMLAIIGNIIDYGAKQSFDIDRELNDILNPDFDIHSNHKKSIFEFDEFKKSLSNTDSVLYIADNTGEVIFDKVLIEEMGKSVTYVVRENPIINDALAEDAVFCGIDKIAKVISSGCDAPGVILDDCNEEFIRLYNSSKMIISKGQGNFEALSTRDSRPIFYLFRVKCDVVANHVGFSVGDIILKNNLNIT